MTPSQLKYKHEQANPESVFFDRKTMKFWGDTMSNYGVRKVQIEGRDAFELYRKKPVKNGIKFSAYFDAETFKRIHI